MLTLPHADPGTPDSRTPARYLLWLAREQGATLAGGVAFGVLWMASQALVPLAIGRAIDAGVAGEDRGQLIGWASAVLGLGVVTAVSGIFRHRFAVVNWLAAAYRTVQITVRHATKVGASLPQRLATGEVVSIGTTDIAHIGGALEITARGSGAIVAFVLVAVIMLSTSTTLGLIVLIGVPLLGLAITPLLQPLHQRQHEQREQSGKLTTVANDIVAGLRVLRGIGGEGSFAGRFRVQSQRVRVAGLRVATIQSFLDAAQVLLPGVFVFLVTWLGARSALSGTITLGELVAFYAYAAFLVGPLRTGTEAADKVTRGLVAARRVVRLLAVQPHVTEATDAQPAPAPGHDPELVDVESGLAVERGSLVAVAASDPADASALADRIGRYVDAPQPAGVLWRGVPIDRLPLPTVRERILVADADARLFAGQLRTELDTREREPAADAVLHAALYTASAADITDGLDDGLDSEVEERGRTFSGGQRQRLILARALVADPDVLVLVEPTSAVDAHTEARIARRLRAARADRTTVVMTTSPLVLDGADEVAFIEGGKVVATGRHRELLAELSDYRAVVTRGEED